MSIIQNFRRSDSGNYAIMLALTLPVLICGVGFAVDVATMSSARSQLQSTLDAAILAASRLGDVAESRQDMFDNYFSANIAGVQDLKNVETDLQVDRGATYIATTATARGEVNLNMPFLFGKTKFVSAKANAYESTNKLEVVMVLDNTGSMGDARMAALRASATALVDTVEIAKSPQREVRAALVPFVTAVNVNGIGYKKKWIDRKAKSSLHGVNFNKVGGKRVNHLDLFDRLGLEWKGCVEARPAPYNFDDTAPDKKNPDTLFVPYFAPDEPGNARYSNDSGTSFNNSYLDETAGGDQRDQQRSTEKYNSSTYSRIDEVGPRTNGPNFACATPIVPLTDDFDALKAEIGKMIYWQGSGTNVAEGLAWGMRVLSPGEPYTQGDPFGDDGVSKVAVVFTDGENNVFGASNEAINKSDYGAYSFVDQGRMGSSNRSTALANINEGTSQICTTLKEKGVEIFTVLLGADTPANRALYSSCASKPSNYFPTTDVSELEDVFRKIGAAVSGLHVTN